MMTPESPMSCNHQVFYSSTNNKCSCSECGQEWLPKPLQEPKKHSEYEYWKRIGKAAIEAMMAYYPQEELKKLAAEEPPQEKCSIHTFCNKGDCACHKDTGKSFAEEWDRQIGEDKSEIQNLRDRDVRCLETCEYRMDRMKEEEHEFRKALLDVLQSRLSNLYGCDGKDKGQLWGDIKDLRTRFLPKK